MGTHPIFESDFDCLTVNPRTSKMAHCVWKVPLGSGNHVVEFLHGTTTGSRQIKVDGVEVLRHDWMFRLVGEEKFVLGPKKVPCRIRIEAIDGFTYTYKLYVADKELEKFVRESTKKLIVWKVASVAGDSESTRVALERDALDVWLNGVKIETESGFTEDGSEMTFQIGSRQARIVAVTSGKRREGILHQLIVDDVLIPAVS